MDYEAATCAGCYHERSLHDGDGRCRTLCGCRLYYAPEIAALLAAIAEHDVWYWDDGLDYHALGSVLDDWQAAGMPGLPKGKP